jgi:hypothetical protein
LNYTAASSGESDSVKDFFIFLFANPWQAIGECTYRNSKLSKNPHFDQRSVHRLLASEIPALPKGDLSKLSNIILMKATWYQY